MCSRQRDAYFGVIGIVLFFGTVSIADGHEHGKDDILDWYDPACCSINDCKPVPDDTIEFFSDALGNPIVRYKPTGNIFERGLWKTSQDERFHVCIANSGRSLCVYVRTGA